MERIGSKRVRGAFWAVCAGIAALGLGPASWAAPQPSARAAAQAYRLGSGDHVRITVYNEPNLSGEFQVSDGGSIALPLIGSVKAAGLSVPELEQAVTATFADGWLNNPKVSIEVLTYRPFYILGEVMKPGEYPFSAGLTVLKAVATANGFTYRANTKTIVVRHEGETVEHAEPLSPTTTVQPGDTIRVKERFF